MSTWDVATSDSPSANRAGIAKSRAILAGLACGIVIGTTLGLLLAPKSGRDTRAWIAAQGREARRRARKLLDPSTAQVIVREHGIRGLVEAVRRAAAEEPRDADAVMPVV